MTAEHSHDHEKGEAVHGHDHGKGGHAGHDHTAGANERSLKIALALTCAFLVVELAGGFIAHSLALLEPPQIPGRLKTVERAKSSFCSSKYEIQQDITVPGADSVAASRKTGLTLADA